MQPNNLNNRFKVDNDITLSQVMDMAKTYEKKKDVRIIVSETDEDKSNGVVSVQIERETSYGGLSSNY